MPVPVPPVDRQADRMPPEFGTQGVDQFAHLTVDRTGTPAMIIMLGHLEQTLAGDVPAPRHVLQKRKDIFLLFRTAEADDQDRIVFLLLGSNILQRSAVGVFCLIHAYHLTRETMDDGILFCRPAAGNLKSRSWSVAQEKQAWRNCLGAVRKGQTGARVSSGVRRQCCLTFWNRT